MSKLKIEIVESDENTLKMSKKMLVEHLQQYGILQLVTDFDIDESLLYSLKDNYTKKELNQLLKSGKYIVSESMIEQMIQDEFLEQEDINEMSMNIYQNFTKDFIDRYKEHINWHRMMIYLSCSEDIDYEKFIDIIKEKDLWNSISCNQLDKDFIRKYKDELNWDLVYLVNHFSEEELEEFKDHIVERKYVDQAGNEISLSEIENIIKNMTTDKEKQNIIEKMNEKMKHLSSDEIKKVEQIIDVLSK